MAAAVLPLVLAGCSGTDPNDEFLDFERWQKGSRALFEQVEVFASPDGGGGDNDLMIGADMPIAAPENATWVYTTALALTGLGPRGVDVLDEPERGVVLSRLRNAAVDPSALESDHNAGPIAYTAYEMAWADRMSGLFSDDERAELASLALGDSPSSQFGSTHVDLTDVYVTVSALVMLKGEGAVLSIKTATERFLASSDLACEGSSDEQARYRVLSAAAMPPEIRLPCTAAQVRSIWEASAEQLADVVGNDKVNVGDLTFGAATMAMLEQVRTARFSDDDALKQTMVSAFDGFALTAARMTSTDADGWAHSVQKAGLSLGRVLELTDEQTAALRGLAVTGSMPVAERFGGPSLMHPLLAARALGIELQVSQEDLAGADPVERLAVHVGSGSGLDAQARALVRQVGSWIPRSDEARVGVLDLVAQLLLRSPTDRCWAGGIGVVEEALSAGPVGAMLPSSVALAVRLLESCDRPIDPRWIDHIEHGRSGIVEELEKVETHRLPLLAEMARIQCAAEPEKAEVGKEQWTSLIRDISPDGGAVGPDGFLSLMLTHQAVQIIETTNDDCATTGLLGGTPE